jgi:large-conductance mechanosensitive channel
MFIGLRKDIISFISGRDLVVFAIGLILSAQLQTTLKSFIDNLIMPFVSKITGSGNLEARSWKLTVPLPGGGTKDLGIKVGWGAAIHSVIVFIITLVTMVKVAKYITVNYVKSASVSFQ